MRTTRRALLGAAAMVSVAGCTGGAGDGGGATASPTDEEATATVRVRSHESLGDILVGPDGLTLYMFDKDTQGEGASACSDDCADAWPPLTVDETPTRGESVTAELETFERAGGDTQVTAGGWPLYYFAQDQEAGDAKGQGVGDVWWALAPDGTPVRSTATATETESGGSGVGYGAVRQRGRH